MARELVAIPVREVPGGIEVVVVEVPEPSVQSEITAALGLRVTFVHTPRNDILRAIDASYSATRGRHPARRAVAAHGHGPDPGERIKIMAGINIVERRRERLRHLLRGRRSLHCRRR